MFNKFMHYLIAAFVLTGFISFLLGDRIDPNKQAQSILLAEPIQITYVVKSAPRVDEESLCLARVIFGEGRGESYKGQLAISEVVLNRVKSPRYPNTICEVVNQSKIHKGKRVYQFSASNPKDVNYSKTAILFSYMGGKDIERRARDRAIKAAKETLSPNYPKMLHYNVLHYHSKSVNPFWADKNKIAANYGYHIFYANIT